MKSTKDIYRVWWEDGVPKAMMHENGTDTVYMLKRASKEDKDHLFDSADATVEIIVDHSK